MILCLALSRTLYGKNETNKTFTLIETGRREGNLLRAITLFRSLYSVVPSLGYINEKEFYV